MKSRVILALAGLAAAVVALFATTVLSSAQVSCLGGGPQTLNQPGLVYFSNTHSYRFCDSNQIFYTELKWRVPGDLALVVTRPDGTVVPINNNNPPGNYEAYLALPPLPGGIWSFEVVNRSDWPVTYNLRLEFTADPRK